MAVTKRSNSISSTSSNECPISSSNADFINAFDDIHTRFILNLPASEISSADRIFFQIEQAYWFYEDCVADDPDSPTTLPRFRHLKPFAEQMFRFSPLLDTKRFRSMWEAFSRYKRKISTYGTILLNDSCTKAVLCLTWDGKSWSFPAGKVNQAETGLEAGCRETYEETGFDPAGNLGHAKTLKDAGKKTWRDATTADSVAFTEDGTGKRRTCYVLSGVPEDFPFCPVARKEVSEVAWHDLNHLPKKSFAVFPFFGQLRRWIKRNHTGKEPTKSAKVKSKSKQHSGSHKPGKPIRQGDSVMESGLASIGDMDRWPEDSMFETNEKLIGKKIEYNGNPHTFAIEKGSVEDPHRFHIVGGQFLNSSGKKIAPPPKKESMQKLWNPGEDKQFHPFFSDQGMTPWGDLVKKASSPMTKARSNAGSIDALPAMNISESDSNFKDCGTALSDNGKSRLLISSKSSSASALNSTFLIDNEVTSRSQSIKAGASSHNSTLNGSDGDNLTLWVKSLKQSQGTLSFGDFKFDLNAIMMKVDQKLLA